MFHSRILNNKINKLHESVLRIVYKTTHLSFNKLLTPDKSFSIHRNLQKLATEMYKIKIRISPTPIQELFPLHDNIYNLRNERCWQTFNVRTVAYGTETLLYRGRETWKLLPEELKNSTSLPDFRSKIKKKWQPVGCACRLCKIYIHNVGFI